MRWLLTLRENSELVNSRNFRGRTMGAQHKLSTSEGCENFSGELPVHAFSWTSLPRPSQHFNFTVHIVAADAAVRARKFRLLTGLGFHCEIYSSVAELVDFRPPSGIALIHDFNEHKMIEQAIAMLNAAGIQLSVVGCAENPTIQNVVNAMQSGAISYLPQPFDPRDLSNVMDGLMAKHETVRHSLSARSEAKNLLSCLSIREREVLKLIANGNSNKGAARLMGISPRTVEIHRMKMMGKLAAKSAADAVKIWIHAGEG